MADISVCMCVMIILRLRQKAGSCVDRIQLAKDREQVVNTVMNLNLPKIIGDLLISLVTVGFSK